MNLFELTYDFSIADTQSYGNKQQKQLSDGAYALFAGDINGDGIISYSDFNLYLAQTGSINTYNDSDINLDANTSTFDFNLYLPNASYIGVM